jgi:hypothetical protein
MAYGSSCCSFPGNNRTRPSSLSQTNLADTENPSPTGMRVETRPLFGS